MMTGQAGLKLALAMALALPAALLAGAYISQFFFGLAPCEMCWWQRWPHFAALGFALLAMVQRPGSLFLALAALAIAVSGAIGGFHAGVEYGWWEGVTACVANPVATGVDPLEAIMNAPLVRCDIAPWTLAGVSLAGWNFLFSAAGALTIALLLVSNGKKDAP